MAHAPFVPTPSWRLASSFLLLLPVGFAVWFAAGVDPRVPMADQWALLSFYGRVVSGEAGLQDLLAPHNGLHVILVGRLILLGIALLTDWSFRAELAVCLALALATWLMILCIARRTFGGHDALVRASGIFSVALLFAPEQHAIWVWSVGFFHYFENAAFIGAVYALTRPVPRLRWAALLCGAATFNRFEGLFAWFVLLPLVVTAREGGQRRKAAMGWCLCAAACSAVCLLAVRLLAPNQALAPPNSFGLLGARAAFAVSLMGSSIASFSESSDPGVGPAFSFVPAGAVVLATYLALAASSCFSRRLRARTLPWICIGAFGVAFSLATAIGRASVPTGGQVSVWERLLADWFVSSYSATSALVTLAAGHLLAFRIAELGARRSCAGRALGGTVSALWLSATAANYAHALPLLLSRRGGGAAERHCVELAAYMDTENTCMIPEGGVELLRKAHLRQVKTNLVFSTPKIAGELVPSTTKTAEWRWALPKTVVHGWVSVPPGESGTALLAFDENRRFFAQASALSREGERVLFRVEIPDWMLRMKGRSARAWWYEAERSRFVLLRGAVEM